jgi:hypothetical protein
MLVDVKKANSEILTKLNLWTLSLDNEFKSLSYIERRGILNYLHVMRDVLKPVPIDWLSTTGPLGYNSPE